MNFGENFVHMYSMHIFRYIFTGRKRKSWEFSYHISNSVFQHFVGVFPICIMSKIQPYDLHDAAEHGNLEFFGNLLSTGLPTNLFNGLGQLPIHTAVIHNQIPLGNVAR